MAEFGAETSQIRDLWEKVVGGFRRTPTEKSSKSEFAQIWEDVTAGYARDLNDPSFMAKERRREIVGKPRSVQVYDSSLEFDSGTPVFVETVHGESMRAMSAVIRVGEEGKDDFGQTVIRFNNSGSVEKVEISGPRYMTCLPGWRETNLRSVLISPEGITATLNPLEFKTFQGQTDLTCRVLRWMPQGKGGRQADGPIQQVEIDASYHTVGNQEKWLGEAVLPQSSVFDLMVQGLQKGSFPVPIGDEVKILLQQLGDGIQVDFKQGDGHNRLEISKIFCSPKEVGELLGIAQGEFKQAVYNAQGEEAIGAS